VHNSTRRTIDDLSIEIAPGWRRFAGSAATLLRSNKTLFKPIRFRQASPGSNNEAGALACCGKKYKKVSRI
jgi:hypothetical protein